MEAARQRDSETGLYGETVIRVDKSDAWRYYLPAQVRVHLDIARKNFTGGVPTYRYIKSVPDPSRGKTSTSLETADPQINDS